MKVSKYIDHTLLKMDATKDEITKLCNEAIQYDFKSICVNTCWVKYCHELLKDSDVLVCCVIGFPLGSCSTKAKVEEVKDAILNGADEIDMVLNVGYLKSNMIQEVLDDLLQVRKACSVTLKLILETCLLSDEEIIKACELAKQAKMDFVKTSTGFSSGGASVHAVKLMKQCVKNEIEIKASGGIRTKSFMNELIEAGATRIGASASISLISQE